jgi:hypothetical protein
VILRPSFPGTPEASESVQGSISRCRLFTNINHIVRVRSFAELTTADERTRRFTSLGFATSGMLTPEASAAFQQQTIEGADLVDAVPEATRNSFDRIRLFQSDGVLCYDLFTLTDRSDLDRPRAGSEGAVH